MKNILLALSVIAFLTSFAAAQQLDEDCNPLAVPPECQQFADSVRRLDTEISELQERLRTAGAQKGQLVSAIRRLNSQRDSARADLARCRTEHGAAPRQLAPNTLNASLTGTATLQTTDGNAPGPFTKDINIALRFSRNRCVVTITNFPSLTLRTRSLPVIGRINVTVTKTGGGQGAFHPISGVMSMPITLHFHYDSALVADDDATFDLTTTQSISRNATFNVTGSPLTPAGDIRLVGTTRFRNGYLAGKEGSLVITATIAPHP